MPASRCCTQNWARPDRAHAHLAAAVAASSNTDWPGLFQGWAGLALAARANARDPQDYARALGVLDERIAAGADELVTAHATRRATREPGPSVRAFDLISGLCGIGAYYLAAGLPERLSPVLTALATLTEESIVDGHVVPGWWVTEPPGLSDPDGRYRAGHLNLGVAHGIAGPLALLSLAWRAGVRVDGQAAAIDAMADGLLRRSVLVEGTARWPSGHTLDDERRGKVPGPVADRGAWCYGTPGVARSLLLAAFARDRTDWRTTALAALRQSVNSADLGADASLCHGWAGLLLLAQTTATECADDELYQLAGRHAAGVLDRYDAGEPFGFRHPPDAASGFVIGPDRPGLLDGVAGIALALQTYAEGAPTRTGWATTFLVS